MAIKRYKPYTPSRRHMTVSAFDEITAAAQRSNTDWLTLNVTKTAYLQLLSRLNTIPTEQQTLL